MKEQQKKRYTIAIMLGDTQSDYSEELLQSFYTCAQKEDVNIVFLMGPRVPSYCIDVLVDGVEGDYQFDTVFDYVHFTRPDALLITYAALAIFGSEQEKWEFLKQFEDIPYLLMGDIISTHSVSYVMADNYEGMRDCVKHLAVDHGYQKIAFLSGPKNNRDGNERLAAYIDVMKECGLPVSDTMVAYGNYSEQVKEQVEYLLDNNPGLEAIACANDNMAKCCYRVCAARNLQIGRDIAITGYDDVELARTMEPMLTSVSQNGFQFSYVALKSAISMCKGSPQFAQRLPVALHKRSSCGCNSRQAQSYVFVKPEEKEAFIIKKVREISMNLLSSIPYQTEYNHFSDLIDDYFRFIYRNICCQVKETIDMEYLIDILKELIAYPHVSRTMLLEYFSDLMQILMISANGTKEREQLMEVVNTTKQYIHFSNVSKLEQEVLDSNRKAWFVPSFTRDLTMVATEEGKQKALRSIMERLQTMKVKSCYIYLFEEPIIHAENTPLVFPEEIYLNAWFSGDKMICYEEKERPRFTMENGFSSFIQSPDLAILTAFVLFSGEKQYGAMLCEAEQSEISFLQMCSLQIGSLLRFMELNKIERESQKELQQSLKVIQEQNNILSFISEYDELSHLLNRRGFMERAIGCCQQNTGKKAYLIFGDIDHLKEINDCFGHAAGDFAIRSAAERLQSVLPQEAITARIGGDEFISLVLSDDPCFKSGVVQKLKSMSECFNKNCDKPYYVEISVGIYEFQCSSQVVFNELLHKSDELLYQAKAKRRVSVKKAECECN